MSKLLAWGCAESRGRVNRRVGLETQQWGLEKLTSVKVPDVDLAVQGATDSKLRGGRVLICIQIY